MKRNLSKRIITFILVLCMFVPMSAMAADTYYIEVSIEEQDNPRKIVVSESAGYLPESELLLPLVVTAVNERYIDGSLRSAFRSLAMEQIMLEGLNAYRSGDEAWGKYWNKYYDKVANLDETLPLKELLTDMDTPATIAELEVDKEYKISYKNEAVGDSKYGVTYIVTVTRRAYSSGEGPAIADPAVTGVADKLVADDHIAFMQGDDRGNFRPDDDITRAEVAMIFYRLLREQNVEIAVSFEDVAEGAWYAEAVNTLASLGIVNGVGDNSFEPSRAITRAEFAAIATRFAKAAQGGMEFVDVSQNHWAYNNIATAAAYGWVNGVGDNKFEPSRAITRTEAAVIVNRMLGRLGDEDAIDAGGVAQFPDVSKDHWGWINIAEATTGHDHEFNAGRTEESWIN